MKKRVISIVLTLAFFVNVSAAMLEKCFPFMNNNGDITANADDGKVFAYSDPDVFIADALLSIAMLPDNVRYPAVSPSLVVEVYSRRFVYDGVGLEASENTAAYGSALYWQNLGKALKGDFVGMANWEENMYEALIMDYLAYAGKSEAFKSHLAKATWEYEADIMKELADKGVDSLKTLSAEDAKKYCKQLKWTKQLDEANEIFGNIADFATTGIDYYQKMSKVLAVRQANKDRIAFLKEMKRVSNDVHFSNAVDKVVGYYEKVESDAVFDYLDDYATEFLVKEVWKEFVKDFTKTLEIYVGKTAALNVKESLMLLELGTAGFDWFFNTDETSEAMLESVAVYTMGVYAGLAYQNFKFSYTSSCQLGFLGDGDKAREFIDAFENYIMYKTYANTVVNNYLYQKLGEGMWNHIYNLVSEINENAYNDWVGAIESNKNSAAIWLGCINLYRETYNKYAGIDDPEYSDGRLKAGETFEIDKITYKVLSDTNTVEVSTADYGIINSNIDFENRLSLGFDHSAYITDNGDLYTWGYNYDGQLGDGTTTDKYVPTKIMSNVRAVSLNSGDWGEHSACITNNGDLYTWGWNEYGQLGDGTTKNKSVPTKIMSNVKSVSLGNAHSACITNNGDLYTWGGNQSGELGDGTTNNRFVPTKIMSNVKSVSLAFNSSACITDSGDLYTWGYNWSGMLGDGTTTNKNIPVKIMSNVKYAGSFSSCITNNGDLYIWGYNRHGELGDGTTTDKYVPTKIMSNVKSVDRASTFGGFYSACITDSGDLYTWGWNFYGQLGDGTTNDRYVPKRIMSNVNSVSLGTCDYSACVTNNGELYTWGWNDHGQLGDGTTTNRYVPTKITIPNGNMPNETYTVNIPANINYDGFSYSVTGIGESAFNGCNNLTNITIPNSVSNIGDNAFSGCDSLTDVYYNGTRSQWNAIKIASGNEYLVIVTLHCTDSIQDNPTVSFEKGNNAVKLTWNKVNGAEKYGIAGYVGGKWKLLDIGSATASSYVLRNLKAGTNYKIAIVAMFDGKWNMDFANAIVVTPNAAATAKYPVVTSAVKGNQFRLTWTAVPNAQGYAVAVYQNGWKLLKNCSADTLTYTSAKLTSGTYHIAVAAKINGKWDTTDIKSRAVTITIK